MTLKSPTQNVSRPASVRVVIMGLICLFSGCVHFSPNVPVAMELPTRTTATPVEASSRRVRQTTPFVKEASNSRQSSHQATVFITPFAAHNLPFTGSESSASQPPVPQRSADPVWLTGSVEPCFVFDEPQTIRPQNYVGHTLNFNANHKLLDSDDLFADERVSISPGIEPISQTRPFFTQDELFEPSLCSRIFADHQNFYSVDSLVGLSYGFGAGALMANTGFDQAVRDVFQESLTNSFFSSTKELGNGRYTIPAFAVAWAAGSLLEATPGAELMGEWGERSIRSLLVGAPPLLVTQYLTGSSRPGESTSGSHWKPFQDNNGVSGHAFMGSLPFLTAAQVIEEPWLKVAFYAGSTLVPLSRISDDSHYTSQAFLGWWIAFLATRAVDRTQAGNSNWKFAPWFSQGGTGIQGEYRF